MTKVLISLNFVHCMERFATQVYHTQLGAFKGDPLAQQLADASDNERIHVFLLWTEIKRLNGVVYPFGWLFQGAGFILGLVTRLSGRQNIFKADTFVEIRAVKDYSSFLKSVGFQPRTVKLITGIIADEEQHIQNWQKAKESMAAIST
jgi:hypothetical protein